MPGFDGTGPLGNGSIGRGFGPCGKRLRRGFRKGFGWQRRCCQRAENVILTKEEQKKILEAELSQIESEKKQIEKKIKEIDPNE